ncbi:phytanoyl-CoA dioxygenase family protein [Maricaulaceae bacterium EIL42A08]|nr:phytanoyl-CoA dioxygenase family protein [Maricaulaceae bacterium EIL42A08]
MATDNSLHISLPASRVGLRRAELLERDAFDVLGYSAPLPLANPELLDPIDVDKAPDNTDRHNPHIHNPTVRAILGDCALKEAISRLCGADLLIWRSRLFWKGEGSGEIPWHHDKHFYDMNAEDIQLGEIETHFSVLIALTEIGSQTGMLEVLPGTHRSIPDFERDVRPFHKRPPEEHLLKDMPDFLVANRRPVPMSKASFLIFHSALLHRSLPHVGLEPRLGVAVRLCKRSIAIPDALADPSDILAFPLEV